MIHNHDAEAVQRWIKRYQPDFPVALQERFAFSRRYEVFATPFAFLIGERGVITSRGIVSTKQFLGFILTRAGYQDSAGQTSILDLSNDPEAAVTQRRINAHLRGRNRRRDCRVQIHYLPNSPKG